MSLFEWVLIIVAGIVVLDFLSASSKRKKKLSELKKKVFDEWLEVKPALAIDSDGDLDVDDAVEWTKNFFGPDKTIKGKPKSIDDKSMRVWLDEQTKANANIQVVTFLRYTLNKKKYEKLARKGMN